MNSEPEPPDPCVCGQFGLLGHLHGWHNLCRGPPDIALY